MSTIREMFDKVTFLKNNKTKLIVNDKYILTFKDGPFGTGYMFSNFEKENSCNRYYSWADVDVRRVSDLNENPSNINLDPDKYTVLTARLYLYNDMDIIDENGLTAKSMSLVFKELTFLEADKKTITKSKQITNIVKCEFYNGN